MHRNSLIVAGMLLWLCGSAHADTALEGGRRAVLHDRSGIDDDLATFAFAHDAALTSARNPLCPAVTKVRFASSAASNALVTLRCRNWTVAANGAYRYSDPSGAAGGIRSVFYRPATGKLVIKAKGAGYSALPGPVQWVEAHFAIGTMRLCGRFANLEKNDGKRIVAAGPTTACVTCGDGDVQGAEQCDDGNTRNGDGCRADCTVERCRDGIVDPREGCDDGNQVNGDGCDANCTPSACGNGIVAGAEQCDDGNLVSGDGCDANCTPTACGNGIQTAGEACDDGNGAAGDGCRADCTVEVCGDGILDPQEECDDSNTVAGDCCAASCAFEPPGSPCSDGDLCTENDGCDHGACVGAPVPPWVNELDYDGGSTAGIQDGDEFVEIAAPAGTDLGGYSVVAVEGNMLCLTGSAGVQDGEANWTATIPPGTVVGDQTGVGIGFVVLCFANTSTNLLPAGLCDVVLAAPGTTSNLQDGDPVNASPTLCPDGILLRSAGGAALDAVSYEGIVSGQGTYGSFFNVTPYSAGQDQGFKLGVSLAKTTGTLGRATAAAEWRLSGGCVDAGPNDAACLEHSATPGEANPGQSFRCAEVLCGDGIVGGREECDDGAANSNAPDASCRPDCRLPRCGDLVVDPGLGEECEADAGCSTGSICLACGCIEPFDFTVVPGPAETDPPDDGESTILRVSPIFGVTNGTQGDFNPGPVTIGRGAPGPDGKADLFVLGTSYVGARLPSGAGSGRACFRIEQDPDAVGTIDCDGGTNFDVKLSVDSNGTGANGTPELEVGTGAADSGPGAGLLRVVLTGATTSDDTTPCSAATYAAAPLKTAITTATATSEIRNSRQGGTVSVTMAGRPYACEPWASDGPASIAAPNLSLDFVLPFGLGTQDIAQVLRLNDQ